MPPSKDPTSIFEANGSLKPDFYEELRRLATMRMATQPQGQTLQATALVHEAWLRMTAKGEKMQWNDRHHFFSAAAEAMRSILVDNARRKSRQRHGGDHVRVHSEILEEIPSPDQNEEILLLNEGITALEKVDPVRAQVVILKFFGGFKTDEAAKSLGISERSIERHWTCAKVWLFQWMQKTRES